MSKYDIVFVGAGCANISGAHYLNKTYPNVSFLIVDVGTNLTRRDHNSETDCVNGVGGAGLFSDGKFSWHPAGTEVWNLEKNKLRKSYKFIKDTIEPYVEENRLLDDTIEKIPDFPEIQENFLSDDTWKLKNYITHYLSLEQRKQMGIEMSIEYYDFEKYWKHNFLLQHKVIDYQRQEDTTYNIVCQNIITLENTIVNAKHIIFGGGRFMPVWLKQHMPTKFKRVELGVRFAGPSTSKIFSLSKNKDPKFMMTDMNKKIQYRSFCTCREGENVVTNCYDIRTWSGRSDCDPTSESNFGFNLVFKDEKYFELLEFARETQPFDIPLDYLYSKSREEIIETVGKYIYVLDYIKEGLESFINFTIEQSGATREEFLTFRLRGPTIEGVGCYPILDNDLKVPNENLWVVGDATGIFRGIIASMLSGVFVCETIVQL